MPAAGNSAGAMAGTSHGVDWGRSTPESAALC
jgi:hypothetical protein